MVRKAWVKKSISELADIQSGGTPSTINEEYWNGEIRWCTPSDITKNKGIYLEDTERRITESGVENSSAILLPIGTILLCTRATIGEMAIASTPMCTNQGFKNLIPREGVDSLFLYYILHTVKKEMIENAYGSTFLELSKKSLESICVMMPDDEAEQRKISTALYEIDKLINTLEKEIEKKRSIKYEIMELYLTGKKRLGEFKSEWIETTLGDIADIKDGTHQTPHYVEGGIPFYSVETVTTDDFRHVKRISLEEHKELTSSYKIEKGDVLMTRIGTLGKCKYIDWDVDASFYVSLALLKFRGNTELARFIVYLSELKQFVKEVELHSLQYAIPMKINLGAIEDIRVRIPSDIEEIRAINNVLFDIENTLLSIELKKRKLTQIKAGMMSDLLTGKIRLV